MSPLLMDTMMRFRCIKVALVGDIKKAFLMLGVDEIERDGLRFLSVKDEGIYPAGVWSAIQSVRAERYPKTSYEQVWPSDPEFVKKFLEASYVDDLTTGDHSEEDTYRLFMKSKLKILEAGFNKRKRSSKSKELYPYDSI